jgi:hypothetical protein
VVTAVRTPVSIFIIFPVQCVNLINFWYISRCNEEYYKRYRRKSHFLFLEYMKAFGGWRYRSTHIHILRTRWRWTVRFTSLPLYPVGRLHSGHTVGGCVGLRVAVDNFEKSCTCQNRASGRSARSLITLLPCIVIALPILGLLAWTLKC